jgi:predicted O-methyltransferase YrrM
VKDILYKFFFAARAIFYKVAMLNTPTALTNNSSFNARSSSDIAELLPILFVMAKLQAPKTLLELGTRGGESTRALIKVCDSLGITGRSVDLSAAPAWLNELDNWSHFAADDIAFGNKLASEKFWPTGEPFEGIDFLFIDTSHEYQHTVQEISTYWPLVNKGGLVVFHDTHLTHKPTWRLSRKLNWGWNNERGVTRAIEEYLNVKIEESQYYVALQSDEFSFLFNVPWNNGLLAIGKR